MTTLGKIRRNAAAIFAGDAMNKASTFVVYALLSRHATIEEFGLLQFGLVVLYTFNVFAAAGLPTLLTRRVARHPQRAKHLLYHGYAGALLSSVAAMIGMVIFAFVMRYESEMLRVLCLLSIAIIPFALTLVAEAVIRGREEMHLIAIANIPGNALLIAGAFTVLTLGYGVIWLAAVVITARTITFLLAHTLARYACRVGLDVPGIRAAIGIKQLKRSLVFFGNDGINAIWAAVDQVMLSKFASEREIGLLGSSYQIMQPILMVYRAVGHSAFPSLCYAGSKKAVADLTQSLVGLLWRLGVPAAIALIVLAESALVLVYGNEDFRAAGIVVQILAFTLLLDPVNPVLGHGLWAARREKTVLKIVIVNLMLNVVVGLWLISQYGLLGAALTYLIASFVNVLQHCYYFTREVVRVPLWKEIVGIVPAAVCMLAIIACFADWSSIGDPDQRFITPANALIALTIGGFVYLPLAFPKLRSMGAQMLTSPLQKA